MPRTIAIAWLRRDLRLHDNSALVAAAQANAEVLPVFVYELDAVEGAAGKWWLHSSLAKLQAALRALGSDLVLREGDALSELRKLVSETGAREVHWNRRYDPAGVAHDTRIKQALQDDGVAAISHAGQLLHEPTAVRTRAGAPFRVFTPFWKTLSASLQVTPPLAPPSQLQAPSSWPASMSLADFNLLPSFDWTRGLRAGWQPGEEGALAALRTFVEHGLEDYSGGRNFPSRQNVSRLSPHLHFGELSPRQVWHAMLAADAPEEEKNAFLREIGWREFTHHVLFHFPHTLDQPLYEKYRGFPWRENYAELLRAWQQGRTGYPLIDAGMRQLWQTGWMHNRVRMVVASFLVKNLRIPWQEGAAWFMDTLVDADLANNTFNWQWAAGCGADAAPYFRIFNPYTQSEKFEAENYIREFVPELRELPDKSIHKPHDLPEALQKEYSFTPGRDYPLPIVDYRESREEALQALATMREMRAP